MKKKLMAHKSVKALHEIDISWEFINGQKVRFDFDVQNYSAHTSDQFSKDYKENWGLWGFDVVEVFLQRENTEYYLELQSSPKGQPFALIIEKPRVSFYPPESLTLHLDNEVNTIRWRASITISISDIPGSGNKLFGNCFACLGQEKNREYYALNINKEELPDFHRPEYFQELGEFKC